MPPFKLRTPLTAAEVLLYLQTLWKDGYKEFPNLRGLSPAQVLGRLPDDDERYRLGEAGLRAVLREVK
jgi:hypothetical protein